LYDVGHPQPEFLERLEYTHVGCVTGPHPRFGTSFSPMPYTTQNRRAAEAQTDCDAVIETSSTTTLPAPDGNLIVAWRPSLRVLLSSNGHEYPPFAIYNHLYSPRMVDNIRTKQQETQKQRQQ